MIIDQLNNTLRYKDIHPLFPFVFDYLNSVSYDNLTIGKKEIISGKVYYIVEKMSIRPISETSLEIHKKFIDIQIPVDGIETFGWKPTCELSSVRTGYSDDKDIAFYHDKAQKYVELKPGQFIIFFPEDAHQPGICDNEHLKIIIKIAV